MLSPSWLPYISSLGLLFSCGVCHIFLYTQTLAKVGEKKNDSIICLIKMEMWIFLWRYKRFPLVFACRQFARMSNGYYVKCHGDACPECDTGEGPGGWCLHQILISAHLTSCMLFAWPPGCLSVWPCRLQFIHWMTNLSKFDHCTVLGYGDRAM